MFLCPIGFLNCFILKSWCFLLTIWFKAGTTGKSVWPPQYLSTVPMRQIKHDCRETRSAHCRVHTGQVYATGSHSDLKARVLIDPSEGCCRIWSDRRFFRPSGAHQRVINIPACCSLHNNELLYISFNSFIQSINKLTKFSLFRIKVPRPSKLFVFTLVV